MSTISKKIADDIVAGKYADDNPTAIVEYTNAWGSLAYGVVFDNRDASLIYREFNYVINPRLYWTKKDGLIKQ